MSVAFIFPGQGSQVPGMLHTLPNLPVVVRTLDEISEVLQYDVRDLDSEPNLDSDVSVQLALFASGVSTGLALMEEGVRPAAVSGLSVGAFAAAVTAGVLGLRDGVELVRLRAKEMIKLYSTGYGLSAIVGLSESQVTKIVEATTSSQAPVFVGNINAPRQIVIAGANVAMDKVLEEALRQGAGKAFRLHVSVLSHCPLLQPVADKLQERISAMPLHTPAAIYVGNINARALRTKELVANDLANNITCGVRWHDATTVLKELGCTLFLEMPPGHVLSDLAQANLPNVNSIPLERTYLPTEGRQFCSKDISNGHYFRNRLLSLVAIREWISREPGWNARPTCSMPG
jgi:malonate decarboxylase epsilon subunit